MKRKTQHINKHDPCSAIKPIAMLALALVISVSMSAQDASQKKEGSSSIGFFLPVKGKVTMDRNKTGEATVTVYKENLEVNTVETSKNGVFWVELDLDANYSLIIKSATSSPELINIDTHLPEDVIQYPSYECFVDLRPARKLEGYNYYLDFPSAVVQYDRIKGGFYHNEHYYTHIQTKLDRLANAGF